VSLPLAQAQARLARRRISPTLSASGGTERYVYRCTIPAALVQRTRSSLLVLTGAVAFVLLIRVCQRGESRFDPRVGSESGKSQFGAAVGASRWQIVRQLLTESLVLTSLGGGSAWRSAQSVFERC
jgi:hypothetical protein